MDSTNDDINGPQQWLDSMFYYLWVRRVLGVIRNQGNISQNMAELLEASCQ